MTTQPEECVYWFRTYQIDNSDDKILDCDFKVKMANYNREIVSRLVLGDRHDPNNLDELNELIGKNMPYEILTFKQKTYNGSISKADETRCIYSLIVKKNVRDSPETMWFAVFCPSVVCSGTAFGRFGIWKTNFEGIPNLRLVWDYSDAKDYYSKCGTVTLFKDKGDKPVFGVMGKSSTAKFYFSPLSFYLEGRHEDALKKYPMAGYTSGMDIQYLQINTENLV